MKKKSKRRKIILATLVFACLILSLQYVIARIIDSAVEELFADGTGCNVSISDVTVRLLPSVRAKTGDVLIRCDHEAKDAGFSATSLEIRLQFWKLALKQIALRDFVIHGARVKSDDKQSGFINTIDYVVREPKPSPGPKPWHSFVSRGWKVDLDAVIIKADTGPSPNLLIKAGEFYFAFDNVFFLVSEIQRQYPRTKMATRAAASRIRRNNTRWYPLGAFSAKSDVGQGYIDIFEGTLAKEKTLADEGLSFKGKIGVPGEGYFDISSNGTLLWQQLAKLIPEIEPLILAHEPKVDIDFHMSGTHDSPIFKGSGQISLAKPLPIFKRGECALDTLRTSFQTTTEAVSFSNLEIGDLISDSTFELDFNKVYSFHAKLLAEIDRDSPFISRCLSIAHKDEGWFDTTLRNAISNSSNIVEIQGTATPLSLKGELTSNAHQKDARSRSQLQAKFSADEKQLHVTAKERGFYRQVASQPVFVTTSPSPEGLTPFTTERHSNIDAEVSYSFESGDLEIKELEISRYPFQRLIARAAPFLSAKLLDSLQALATPESKLSTKLSLKSSDSFSKYSGNGQVDLRNFLLGTIPVQSASFPFKASSESTKISQAKLVIDAGTATLNAVLPAEGKIDAKLNIGELNLKKISAWTSLFPSTPAVARGFFDIGGTLHAPTYAGEFRVEPQLQDIPSIELLSTIKVTGDKSSFQLSASMFGNRLVADASYPISDATADLTITAEAKNAPLDLFLPKDLQVIDAPTDSISPSELDASFEFVGPKSDPLSGNGKLIIRKFLLFTEGATLTHTDPLVARIANKRLTFTNFELLANQRQLSVDGWIDQESGWNVQLSSDWGLGTVFAKVGGMEQLSGDVKLKLSVAGDLEDPIISGRISLSDGTASLPLGNTFIGAEKIYIDATLTNGALLINDINARVGSGALRGSGVIANVIQAKEREIDIDVDLQSISLEPLENLTLRTGGAINIEQKPGQPLKIKGDVLIDTALYEETVDLRQLVRKTLGFFVSRPTEIAPTTAGQKAPIQLDIRIHAPGNFIVETNIVEAELSADLKILGTSKNLNADGIIEVTEGFFGFQSTRFDIISAHALFSKNQPGIDPELRIVGETAVRTLNGRDHKIQIRIDGRASNPRVKFTSDSGLSENNIVSLLGVGTGSDDFNVFRFSGAEKYDTVEEILDRRNKISTADRIKGLFSFNHISIDSKSDLENNTVVPVVSASRQLTTPTTLHLSSELSSKDRNKTYLDYELTPYLSLLAGWQNRSEITTDSSTGAFIAGVRYQAEFPGTRFLPSLKDLSRIEEW